MRAAVTAAAAPRAQRALEELDRLHRRGLEPQALNFAEVAKTSVELWVDGRAAGVVDVLRAGLNARTLTPPIDPNELATDSPGDRGRPADAAPARSPARRSIWPIRTASPDGSATATRPDSRSHRDELIIGRAADGAVARRTSPRGSDWRRPASRCRSRETADEVRDPRARTEPDPGRARQPTGAGSGQDRSGRPVEPGGRRRRGADCAEGVRESDRDGRRRCRCRRHRGGGPVSGAARSVRVGQPARRVVARRRQDRSVALPRRADRRRDRRRRRSASSRPSSARSDARESGTAGVQSFDVSLFLETGDAATRSSSSRACCRRRSPPPRSPSRARR